MVARRIRNPNRDDLDMTTPEERRARTIRRRLLFAALLVILLLVGGWFAGKPARNAIKGWQARRTAQDAFSLIEKEDWKAAADKARDAYQLSPSEPEAWRAIGRYLSRLGQGGQALEWWAKVADAGRLSLEDRQEYATAALGAGELNIAAQQMDQLLALEGKSPTPGTALLKAQLAVRRMDGVTALETAEPVLNDLRTTPREVLSASLLIIGITAPDSPPHTRAWAKVEEMARDPANPLSLDALTLICAIPPAACTAS